MKKVSFSLISKITVAITFFFVGALGARTIEAATEVARINGAVISLQDFEKRYKEHLKFFQFTAPTRKAVLDEIIKKEIGVQEAKKMGLDHDPEVIDRMNTVLYQSYLDKKLSREFENIQVTDDEAKSFYSKNPEIRTSHIFIAVRPDAKEDAIKQASAQIKEIQSKYLASGKMSFAEVAQKHSEGTAAAMGGDIDWQTRDHLDPAYYNAAVQLSVGEVSPIIKTQFGFHIIKLTGKKPWDEVDRPMIKRMVFDQRRQALYDHLMSQLRAQSRVVVHSELLKD